LLERAQLPLRIEIRLPPNLPSKYETQGIITRNGLKVGREGRTKRVRGEQTEREEQSEREEGRRDAPSPHSQLVFFTAPDLSRKERTEEQLGSSKKEVGDDARMDTTSEFSRQKEGQESLPYQEI